MDGPGRRFDWLLRGGGDGAAHDAAILASKITNPTLRGEMLFRVVDSTAQGSQTISHEAQLSNGKRFDLKGKSDMIGRMADRSLVFAANDSDLIQKPIWRDRAMLWSIAIARAATSDGRFDRGIQICPHDPAARVPAPERHAQ